MTISVAFSEDDAGGFLVLSKIDSDTMHGAAESPCAVRFESENVFLEKIVAADLPQDRMIALTTNVLLSISKPIFPPRWTPLEVSEAQLAILGLSERSQSIDTDSASGAMDAMFPIWNFKMARHFHEFLMQAPSPFVMLEGPEHIVTFMNPPYVELIGRESDSELIGRPIREGLPELEGQPFFGLLDNVYRTGTPFVGKEVPARLQNQKSSKMNEHYFDFVYHPAHDATGEVFGIFVQAFDVTERVLARQVTESREEKLYRHWAELDTMYRTSPVGMCLIDAKNYSVLRMNDKLASLAGESSEALLGRKITEIFPGAPQVEDQFKKVVGGDYVRNFEVTLAVPAMPGLLRQWLLNFGPLCSASGEVEAITCVSLEITDQVKRGDEDDQDPVSRAVRSEQNTN